MSRSAPAPGPRSASLVEADDAVGAVAIVRRAYSDAAALQPMRKGAAAATAKGQQLGVVMGALAKRQAAAAAGCVDQVTLSAKSAHALGFSHAGRLVSDEGAIDIKGSRQILRLTAFAELSTIVTK